VDFRSEHVLPSSVAATTWHFFDFKLFFADWARLRVSANSMIEKPELKARPQEPIAQPRRSSRKRTESFPANRRFEALICLAMISGRPMDNAEKARKETRRTISPKYCEKEDFIGVPVRLAPIDGNEEFGDPVCASTHNATPGTRRALHNTCYRTLRLSARSRLSARMAVPPKGSGEVR